jgi:hypothetical protein
MLHQQGWSLATQDTHAGKGPRRDISVWAACLFMQAVLLVGWQRRWRLALAAAPQAALQASSGPHAALPSSCWDFQGAVPVGMLVKGALEQMQVRALPNQLENPHLPLVAAMHCSMCVVCTVTERQGSKVCPAKNERDSMNAANQCTMAAVWFSR